MKKLATKRLLGALAFLCASAAGMVRADVFNATTQYGMRFVQPRLSLPDNCTPNQPCIYANFSDNHLYFQRTTGVSVQLDTGGGGGGSTDGLLGAYLNASSTARNIIGLTGGLGPVLFRDNAAPLGGDLVSVQSSGGTPFFSVGAYGVLIGGGIQVPRTPVVDADYVAVAGDELIVYTSITATRKVTLQNSGTATRPREYEIKNETASAQTIQLAASAGNVDGAATVNCCTTAYGSCLAYCNGTNCFVRGSAGGVTSVTGGGPISAIPTTGAVALDCPTCVVTSGSYANPSWITSLAASKLTGQVAIANGGTNTSTIGTAGEVAYSDGSKIAYTSNSGSTTQVLHGSAAGAPSFSAVGLTTDVSGVLPVANGGTNSSTALSASAIAVSNGSAIVQGPLGATTQVLHGNAAGLPTYSQVSLTADVSGILPLANGGTGAASLNAATILNGAPGATGDIPYSTSGTQAMSFLADVATGSALISGGVGGAPTYGKIGLTTHVSGVLPVANGGTNSSTIGTAGEVAYSDGSKVAYTANAGATTQVLHGSAAGAPSFSAVSLTADVSGVLPIANGGTNSSTALSGSSIMISNGSAVVQGAAGTTTTLLHGNAAGAPTYSQASLTADVTGTLPIANGGTNGTATPTNGGVAYGTGSAYAFSAAGTSGQFLKSAGASSPVWTSNWNDGLTTANVLTGLEPVTVAPGAVSGGSTALHVTPAADTALTVDANGFWLDYTGVTVTCTHGSCPSLLRAARITPPTYTTSSATDTVPMAASLSVGSAPSSSGGLTITTTLALRVGNGNVMFGDLDATTGAVTNASYLGLDIKPTYGFHQLGNGQRAQAIGAPTGVSITNNGANNSTRQDYVLWPRDAAGNAGAPVYVTQIVGATVPNNSVNFTLPAGAKTLDVYLQYDSTGRSAGSVCTGLTASPCSDANNSTSAFTLPLLNLSAKSTNDSAIAIGQTSDPTNTLTMAQGSMFIQSLATPAAPTAAFTGTNNGKQNGYYYYCFTGDGQQNGIASANLSTTSVGSTQLSPTNYWTITIAPPTGSGYCTIVRYLAGSNDSAGNPSTGVIATKIPATTTSFRDTGIVATALNDQTTIEPVIFITEPTAANATITQQAAGGILWKSPAWASTAVASRDNYGYLGFRGLTGSTTTGEFVLAFEVNNTPGSAQVFADAFRFDQGGYIRSPSTGNQLAMMNSSLGGTGGFLLLSGTHVFIGDSGSTVLQTISTALEPLADDGAMNLGATAVRFRNAFFSRGIMVAPASTTQLAAGHFQAGGIVAKALTAATISSIGQNGAAGSTSYTYVLATIDLFGNKVWSAPVTTALGNATLSSSNNNQINVTIGSAGSNGITYNLYRIASAGSGGGAQIGLVASGQTAASVNDIGNAATGSQTTGALHNATADTTFDSLSTMGYVTIAPVAQTQNLAQYSVANFTVSNPVQALKLTSAAHTGLLTAVEFTDVSLDFSANLSFNSGTVATERRALFKCGATLSGISATATFTDEACVAISGADSAGSNAAFTNTASAFWVQSGQTRLDGDLAINGATPKFKVTASSGLITSYNNEATDGTGVVYEVKKGQDVASAGGGAQTTAIADFTIASSGSYEAWANCSATTSDTVTVVVTYTDAVNTTAQTVNILNAVSIGTNGVADGKVGIRANTSTHPIIKITNSSQASTKCSGWLKRAN